MNNYLITYTQELTQVVRAEDILQAGRYARNYAAANKMVVVQIYNLSTPTALPAPVLNAPSPA